MVNNGDGGSEQGKRDTSPTELNRGSMQGRQF